VSLSEKLKTRVLEARAMARIVPEMPRLLPNSKWTPVRYLDLQARKYPDSPAIKYLDLELSWSELRDKVDLTAAALANIGVKRGTKFALLMDNRPEFLILLLAASRLQAVAVLLNTSIVGKSLAHCINIANASIFVGGSEHLGKIMDVLPDLEHIDASAVWMCEDPFPEAGPGSTGEYKDLDAEIAKADPEHARFPSGGASITDECCYIYTSGTTGLPKAAIVNNQRLLAAGALFARCMFNLKPGETMYVASPLYHSMALNGGFSACLVTGACLAFRRRFSATEFWDDVRKFEVDTFTYIGELCRYLVNQPPREDDRDHPMRAMGGVGLAADVWRVFVDRFGVRDIREMYGATEGSGGLLNFTGKIGMMGRKQNTMSILRCDLENGELLRDSKGRYQDIDEGETGLLVNQVTVLTPFDGYLDREASKKKLLHNVFKDGDCYFNTGDLVTLHEDGWLSFADRVGDTFRWKGENVSTNEVAEFLNACSGVLESNVYGVEVPGSEGRAGMASLNIDDSFAIADLEELVKRDLTSYQRPYFVRLQHEMRLTQTFKHQKVDYRKEGFNPAMISDPMYFLQRGSYVPLDEALFQQITSGEVEVR
jgi:acyl-CoA synthetase (AMP-forming)/AMP-acid ligase II